MHARATHAEGRCGGNKSQALAFHSALRLHGIDQWKRWPSVGIRWKQVVACVANVAGTAFHVSMRNGRKRSNTPHHSRPWTPRVVWNALLSSLHPHGTLVEGRGSVHARHASIRRPMPCTPRALHCPFLSIDGHARTSQGSHRAMVGSAFSSRLLVLPNRPVSFPSLRWKERSIGRNVHDPSFPKAGSSDRPAAPPSIDDRWTSRRTHVGTTRRHGSRESEAAVLRSRAVRGAWDGGGRGRGTEEDAWPRIAREERKRTWEKEKHG